MNVHTNETSVIVTNSDLHHTLGSVCIKSMVSVTEFITTLRYNALCIYSMRAQSREQKLLLFFWKRKNAQICRWFPFIGINDFRSKQNSWLLTKTETE